MSKTTEARETKKGDGEALAAVSDWIDKHPAQGREAYAYAESSGRSGTRTIVRFKAVQKSSFGYVWELS